MGLKFKPGDVVSVSWLEGVFTVVGYDSEYRQYKVSNERFIYYPLTREMKLLNRRKEVKYPEDGTWV